MAQRSASKIITLPLPAVRYALIAVIVAGWLPMSQIW